MLDYDARAQHLLFVVGSILNIIWEGGGLDFFEKESLHFVNVWDFHEISKTYEKMAMDMIGFANHLTLVALFISYEAQVGVELKLSIQGMLALVL